MEMEEEARESFFKRTDLQDIPNGKKWEAGKGKLVSFLCFILYSKRVWRNQEGMEKEKGAERRENVQVQNVTIQDFL